MRSAWRSSTRYQSRWLHSGCERPGSFASFGRADHNQVLRLGHDLFVPRGVGVAPPERPMLRGWAVRQNT